MSLIYQLVKQTNCGCYGLYPSHKPGEWKFGVDHYIDRIEERGQVVFRSKCTIQLPNKCKCPNCPPIYGPNPKCKGSEDRWQGFEYIACGDATRNPSISFETKQEIRRLETELSVYVMYGEGSRSGPYVILRDVVRWLKAHGIKRTKRLNPYKRYSDCWFYFESREYDRVAKAIREVKRNLDRLHSEALKENKQREERQQWQHRRELETGRQLLRQSRALVQKLAPRASRRMESPAPASLMA